MRGPGAAWANPVYRQHGRSARGAFRNPVTGNDRRRGQGCDYNANTGNYAADEEAPHITRRPESCSGGAHGVVRQRVYRRGRQREQRLCVPTEHGNGIAYNGNNVYADHNGNVYRASPSRGWQQQHAAAAGRPASSDFRSSLDSQSFSRDWEPTLGGFKPAASPAVSAAADLRTVVSAWRRRTWRPIRRRRIRRLQRRRTPVGNLRN